MKVLVDTPIWSYAFRHERNHFTEQVKTFKNLISDQRVLIIGAIKQEILSGYSDLNKFAKLVDKLKYFENSEILNEDFIQAAKFSNICRSNGVQGSPVDFLICAVSFRLNASIFTTDKDFTHYQKHIPIELL